MFSIKKLLVVCLISMVLHQQYAEAHLPILILKKAVHWGSKAAAVAAVGAVGKGVLLKTILIKKGLAAKGAAVGLIGLKKAGLVTAGVLGAKKAALIGGGILGAKAIATKAIVAKAIPIKILLAKGAIVKALLSKIHMPQVIDLPQVHMPINAVVRMGSPAVVEEVEEVSPVEIREEIIQGPIEHEEVVRSYEPNGQLPL